MSTKKHIAKATLIILFFSIFGKFFGFIREIIIAGIFGTTAVSDAYFVGLSVPDFVREIISGAVLTAVFIPVYSVFIQKNDHEKSLKFLNTISTGLILIMLFAMALCMPLAPYLVKMFAPDLSEPAFSTAVNIARIIFPATVFMGLAGLYGSLLNVHKHFLTPSLLQLMLNLGVIGGAVLLSRKLGIYSLAVGFVAGAAMQFIVLVPSLRFREIKFSFKLQWFPEFKQMFYLWVPLFFASFASVGMDIVSRALASGLDSGNIAALNFAARIRETVWLFCGVPLGTAVFPFLSSIFAEKNSEEFKKIVIYAIRTTVFIALPFSLFMLVYSKPIISILFERGAFDRFSSSITSSALTFYSTGALFYALNYVVLRVYYSCHDMLTPLKIFSAAFFINLFAGLLLRKYLFVGGIALARSLSDIFCFITMLSFLGAYISGFRIKEIFANIIQILLISVFSIGASNILYIFVPYPSGLTGKIILIIGTGSVSAILYMFFCRLFKVKELNSVLNIIKDKIAKYGANA